MAGTTLTFSINDREFQGRTRELRRRLASLDKHELLNTMGGEILARTMKRFEDAEAPDGSRWPVTIRQKMGDSRSALLGQGSKLTQSYTYRADSNSTEIGSNLKYAAIHHFGGTIRAKRAKALRFRIGDTWVMKKAVTIPARPALGVNDEDERYLVLAAEDWLKLALKDFLAVRRS